MGVLLICLLLVSIGGLLTTLGARCRPATDILADRIDAVLPQTQCTRCGFPACRPYAEAIARGDADIDRCPPGGDEGIRSLARLLGVAAKPLNPAHGAITAKQVAVILEDQCIGCALCLKACPVDAIVGAPQWMHTVIPSECTGCALCLAPCPVDCIELRPAATEQVAEVSSGTGLAAAASPDAMAPECRDTLPCIRCGFCADVCPEKLAPQQLLFLAAQGDHVRATSFGLFDCTECGICDDVCPSRIPLTHRFREAKAAIVTQRHARSAADHARQRYQARNLRLERERQRRDDLAQRQRAALAKPGADAIAAAVERARMRKQAIRTDSDQTAPGDGRVSPPPGAV